MARDSIDPQSDRPASRVARPLVHGVGALLTAAAISLASPTAKAKASTTDYTHKSPPKEYVLSGDPSREVNRMAGPDLVVIDTRQMKYEIENDLSQGTKGEKTRAWLTRTLAKHDIAFETFGAGLGKKDGMRNGASVLISMTQLASSEKGLPEQFATLYTQEGKRTFVMITGGGASETIRIGSWSRRVTASANTFSHHEDQHYQDAKQGIDMNAIGIVAFSPLHQIELKGDIQAVINNYKGGAREEARELADFRAAKTLNGLAKFARYKDVADLNSAYTGLVYTNAEQLYRVIGTLDDIDAKAWDRVDPVIDEALKIYYRVEGSPEKEQEHADKIKQDLRTRGVAALDDAVTKGLTYRHGLDEEELVAMQALTAGMIDHPGKLIRPEEAGVVAEKGWARIQGIVKDNPFIASRGVFGENPPTMLTMGQKEFLEGTLKSHYDRLGIEDKHLTSVAPKVPAKNPGLQPQMRHGFLAP